MLLLALALRSNLTHDLNKLLANPKLEGASIAITVQGLDGRVLYQRNPNQRLLPASNEKLLTCAYALATLGPNYRPKTLFWFDNKALIVRADGDPTMPYTTLLSIQKLLNPSRKPIQLSEAYRAGYSEGWQLGDLANRYAAPVYAFTVDRGSLELWSRGGIPVLEPAPFDIAIDWTNREGPIKDRFDVFRHRITLEGAMPAKDTRLDTLGLPETDREAASLLGAEVSFIGAPPARSPDYYQLGQPLAVTLQTCLQMSDNNIAENLLFIAASRAGDLQDPYAEAIPKLKEFLAKTVGLDPDSFSPEDGSGMGRQNLVSVTALAKLLRWEWKQPTAQIWRRSLDRPGSGTMKKRMPRIWFQGKTGTLTGCSALSGYLETRRRVFVVSMISNNFLGPSSDVKAIEDRIIETIAADARDGT